MQDATPDEPEPFEPGWRDRLWAIGAAAGRLLETRKAILQEELAAKGELLGKALLGLFVAVLFGTIAGLLLTALIAAFLAKLLGSPGLGILVTLLIYVGIAAGAGFHAVKKLSGLRPFEFPETRREIDRDLESVRRAAGIGERQPGARASVGRDLPAEGDETPEEMEARLREGAG
jgi:hypothetical protein